MNRIVHRQGESEDISHHERPEGSDGGLFDSVARVAGLALTILGVLFGFGLAILPSSTVGEKAIVFLASLALSIACTAGIGAWRSAKKFTVTATSAALSIICLTLLSIDAASPEQAHSNSSPPTRGIGKATPGSPTITTPPQATVTTPAQSAPSPTPGPTGVSTNVAPLYLANLTGSGSSWESGSWQLAGTTYAHSLGDPDPCGEYSDSVTYQLNRSYSKFVATIGIADNANSVDHYTPLGFEVDGDPNSDGSTNVLGTKSAQWHQPARMSVPLPKGTTSITLTINDTNCEGSTGVWGNARVIP